MRNFLSLGGGVQSTAMLLMALHGEFDTFVDCAVFADTGWEREKTYQNIAFLREYADGFGVPLVAVSNGNIRERALSGDKEGAVGMPVYALKTPDKAARMAKQCTNKYKIRPIESFIRELTGCNSDNPATQWIGFSVDEAHRMSPSRSKSFIKRFPLIEQRISRDDCVRWLDDNGFYIPSKSSCVGCPLHSNKVWRTLTDAEHADVSAFERDLQEVGLAYTGQNRQYVSKTRNLEFPLVVEYEDDLRERGEMTVSYYDNTLYLHPSCTPISERPFDVGKPQSEDLYDYEGEECEGGCFL